jgi:hypothetical protein
MLFVKKHYDKICESRPGQMMERESICELNESKYKFPFLVVGGD